MSVTAPVLARLPEITPDLGPRAQLAWAAMDMATGSSIGDRRVSRLPMCSSFKWLLVAFVLWRLDRGRERLDAQVAFGRGTLGNSPVTDAAVNAGGGHGKLSIGALCDAVLILSDNAAANALLDRVGGPAALTAWLRSIGDPVTRLDRTEPALNLVPLGDTRDTSTPDAMIENLRRILFGSVLLAASRERLFQGMLACRTGPARLTAGLSAGWRIAHRTGTRDVEPSDGVGDRAAAVDLGVLLPPNGKPILIAAFAAGWTRPLPEVDTWFAGRSREAIAILAARRQS